MMISTIVKLNLIYPGWNTFICQLMITKEVDFNVVKKGETFRTLGDNDRSRLMVKYHTNSFMHIDYLRQL